MPTSILRSKRAVAMAVAATVAGVSAVVLLSGQSSPAQAAAAPGSTVRASVGNGTPPPESPSGGYDQELSADGTAVVFTSSSRLDTVETGDQQNVYVRDLRNNRTVLISRGQFTRPPVDPTPDPTPDEPPIGRPRLTGDPLLSLNGAQPTLDLGEVAATGASYQPTISGDGRYVAFVTSADNIVPEDDDTDGDILVCDRDPDGDGTFDEARDGGDLDYRYFRVNVPQWYDSDSGAHYRTDYPSYPKLSDDASRIVWEDYYDTGEGYVNAVRTARLRAEVGGVASAVAAPGSGAQLVSTPLDGQQPTSQYWGDVSADGRYIVLVADYVRAEGGGEFPDYVPFHAVIRRDMESDAVLRVDWDVNTTAEAVTYLSADESVNLTGPSISANGGEIAFEAEEYENYCSEGSCWSSVASQPMVYVVRISSDATPVDSIVASRDNDNEIINGATPALSGDGRFLAFATDNANAHDGIDVSVGEGYSCLTYRGDLARGKMLNLSGLPPTSETRDERVVCQVVVRDLVVDRARLREEQPRLPGTLASAGTGTDCAEEVPDGATCGGDDDSPPYTRTTPSLSHNGSTVAFDSDATNLLPSGETDGNGRTDVFVRTFRPDLRADPTPLDFGEVELGDTFDRVVRFDHVGTGPMVITDVVVEGSDEFALGAQTCAGEAVVLQQAGNCEVSVTFAPTDEGDRDGTLRLTLRDGRQFTVPLRGRGTREAVPPEEARFAAGPDPLAFGDRLLLSDGPTQTVTVTNTGGSPLTVKTVEIVSATAQADFPVTADTCTGKPLAPKGTCQVTVAFSPAASGDRAAVLRFTDDAPGGAAHLIGLTGKGSTPTIQVVPGVTQPGRVVTVGGTGFAPNKPVTITITGSTETAKAVADATGAFSQGLLILPKSTIGNRPVIATIDGTAIKAERPLLIVTPSVTASDFVVRS
ncbi:choice-of-anchor D domain-containing protein [Actinophytocola oryzae]|uniref:WD40 repeat protein n=1 Tax=Actinophytocola oryzae TaxID=502181 RepID=A0A4R7VAZ0_9PSEU|nr:choice-of-anchor D domain-containing protein [Actinophytocola oryzae]TDV46172.1 hypothetical protein CLV71_111130 [Actinophytocola oryzae]